jgi:predicted dehydrogenase
MDQSTLRVGVIGCGGMAQHHMSCIGQMSDAVVAAVADTSPKAIAGARARFAFVRDIPAFADYRQMLKDVPLDAVVIATPHAYHFDQAVDALDAGQHTLVEKPFVPTVEQAELLIARAGEKGKVLAVGYQRRSSGAYRYIKDAIEAGRIGDVQFANVFLTQNWYLSQKGTWRQDPTLSCGGQLNDSGSHLLDVLLWLVGKPAATVEAQIDNLESPVDINAAVLVRFEGGAIGSFAIVGHSRDYVEEVGVYGSKGSLHYMTGRVYERLFDVPYVAEVQRLGPTSTVVGNFVAAIQGKGPLHSTAASAVKVVQLTTSALKSAALREPVRLG